MKLVLQKLREKLDREKIAYKIIELSAPAMTVPDVIKFARTPVSDQEICKTIILKIQTPANSHREVVNRGDLSDGLARSDATSLAMTKDSFVGIFLRGNDRLDMKKIDKYFGRRPEGSAPAGKVRFATAEEVKEHANVDPGAVCPLILKVPLFIDQKALELKNAHFGSGDHMFGLEMDPRDVQKMAKATVGAFV